MPLRSGIGISINKKEAAYYSKSAADKGFIDAINIYGDMLKNNEGITKNLKEATKYYKLAVDIGDVDSMYQYALLSDDDNKNNWIKTKKLNITNYLTTMEKLIQCIIILYNKYNCQL